MIYKAGFSVLHAKVPLADREMELGPPHCIMYVVLN